MRVHAPSTGDLAQGNASLAGVELGRERTKLPLDRVLRFFGYLCEDPDVDRFVADEQDSFEDATQFAVGHVPKPDGIVETANCQHLPARLKADTADRTAMSFEQMG